MEPLSTVGQRLRSPVTWGSAAATLAGLYGLYQYQYQRQLARQRTSGRPDLGGPFSLLDPDGKPVRSADLHGRWVLLYFGFTKCPDICPDELDKVRTVLERLEGRGRDVLPVFITIDPDRDTRPRLKTYFADHDFHPKTLALTGSHEVRRRAQHARRTLPPPRCVMNEAEADCESQLLMPCQKVSKIVVLPFFGCGPNLARHFSAVSSHPYNFKTEFFICNLCRSKYMGTISENENPFPS